MPALPAGQRTRSARVAIESDDDVFELLAELRQELTGTQLYAAPFTAGEDMQDALLCGLHEPSLPEARAIRLTTEW